MEHAQTPPATPRGHRGGRSGWTLSHFSSCPGHGQRHTVCTRESSEKHAGAISIPAPGPGSLGAQAAWRLGATPGASVSFPGDLRTQRLLGGAACKGPTLLGTGIASEERRQPLPWDSPSPSSASNTRPRRLRPRFKANTPAVQLRKLRPKEKAAGPSGERHSSGVWSRGSLPILHGRQLLTPTLTVYCFRPPLPPPPPPTEQLLGPLRGGTPHSRGSCHWQNLGELQLHSKKAGFCPPSRGLGGGGWARPGK